MMATPAPQGERLDPFDVDPHAGWQPSVNPWIVAVTVLLPVFMEVLDTTAANVALPHIAGNLSATLDESTWVLTSYLVSNAVVLPLTGWLSMLFGRKRLYMTCVLLFTASSFLCGIAPNLGTLIACRVLQGFGGGALQPLSQAILLESFPKKKHGMAMAAFGIGVVMAPIIGPTLGGWITDNYTWRWIFFINIPVGLLSVFASSIIIEDPPHLVRKTVRSGLRIDYIGLGLVAVGLAALQIMLDNGEREDWFDSGFIIACAVVAGVCLLAAALYEWRKTDAVVNLQLLRDRNFAVATVTMFMVGFVLYGSGVLLPLFLQTMLGYTATWSGLAMSPGGFVTMAMMPVVGLLLRRFQPRWLVIIGLVSVFFAMWYSASFSLTIDFRTAMNSRMIFAFGLSFLFVPINTMGFANVPRARTNAGTGLTNLARNIGGSVGIAVVTTLLARGAQIHQSALVSHMTPLDPGYVTSLAGAARMLAAHSAGAGEAAMGGQTLLYRLMQRQAVMLSYVDVFQFMALVVVAAMPLMLLIRPQRRHVE